MHRNVADDSGERRRQVVVRKLALLRDARGLGRFPIGLGILEGLDCLFVVLLAGHTCLEQVLLPLQFALVVVEDGLLLRLGAALLIDRRLLLQRIDGHQHLSGAHMVARLHQDAGQRAIHLRLNAGRAPRLNGGHVLVCLWHLRRDQPSWY